MIKHTNVKPTQNTANRGLSLAHPPNTIGAGNSGQMQPFHLNLRRRVFKHNYLTNPLVTPEDLVIAAAENLTQALETSIPQHQ